LTTITEGVVKALHIDSNDKRDVPIFQEQWTLSVITSKNKNGHYSVGTFVKFVWATMGRKILNNDISAKEEHIEL